MKRAEAEDAVDANTVFETCSMSKLVFTYGVMKLVEQGRLDLDRPLGEYHDEPYLKGTPLDNKITARIVLTHTTGFPNWRTLVRQEAVHCSTIARTVLCIVQPSRQCVTFCTDLPMNSRVLRFAIVCFVMSQLTVFPIGQAENWPQFRGPDGQGHAAATNLPIHFGETQDVAWKVPVEGRGWSSPVVWDTQVWVTTAVETAASNAELQAAVERTPFPVPSAYYARHVVLKTMAFDRATGRVVHDLTLFDIDQPILLNQMNSYASPTPVIESGRLYCDFGAMGTVCVDTSAGKVLWSRRLVIEHQVGPGSSPILHGDRLILVRDGCDQQYVVALDKRTGQTVWKTARPPIANTTPLYRKAFSTPLVFTDNGIEQMVVPGAQWIVAYDPTTGRELWRVNTVSTFSNVARPVYEHGLIYVCTAFGGTRMYAIRVDGRGDVTDSHVVWQVRRATPRRSSPLLVGGRLYLVSDLGIASCLDAQTGRNHWSHRLDGPHSASPIFADGHVYFFSESGTITVFRPGDQYELLAQSQIDGRIMASPAFVDHSVFLRTDTHLYRIEATTAMSKRPALGK